jgi:glycosyltransferase involved in cell wall biosynthesis
VATDVGDVADLLDNGTAGAITTPGDAEGLAREVGRLLDQPSEAAAQAERAYERYCNQFTIQVMRQRIAAAYAQAIQLAEARSMH